MEKNATEQDPLFALAAGFCKGGTRFSEVKTLGAGNINDTFLAIPEGGDEPFILQKINQNVLPASRSPCNYLSQFRFTVIRIYYLWKIERGIAGEHSGILPIR